MRPDKLLRRMDVRWHGTRPDLSVGRFVLYFFSGTCRSCLQLPSALETEGLEAGVAGVRVPQFRTENRIDLDHDHFTGVDLGGSWEAAGNSFLPRFLVLESGDVRWRQDPSQSLSDVEHTLQNICGEGLSLAAHSEPERFMLGFQNSPRLVVPNFHGEQEFRHPSILEPESLHLGGRWRHEKDRLVAVEDASLSLRASGDLHLVLDSASELEVSGAGTYVADEPGLHTVAELGDATPVSVSPQPGTGIQMVGHDG